MKVRVNQDEIVSAVCRSLNVDEYHVHMPMSTVGCVWVELGKWNLDVPNDTLAEMVFGDRWDGNASEGAFRFGGGGYDPVWFECGVEG